MSRCKTSNKLTTLLAMEYPGNLYVVAAPSGAGKSSLVKALMELDSRVLPSVSHTTRSPRGQEKHGREYFFVSQHDLNAVTLATYITEALGKLQDMSVAAQNCARLDSTTVVANFCIAEARS